MATLEQSFTTLQDPQLKQQLQELRRTDNFTNVLYLLRTWACLGLVIASTLWFYHAQASQGWNWWWNLPVTAIAIVLIGAGQHQLTGLTHEASHYTLFKNRLINDLVSDWFCMFPMFSSTQHYRLQHLAHHQFVNDPARDPDVSQLKTSGHWLGFPISRATFLRAILKQLWLPNLLRYITIRAAYNSLPTTNNPYLKAGWKPSKTPVRVGLLYLLSTITALIVFVRMENELLLAVVPTALYVGILLFFSLLPERMYHQSRVRPVISARRMTLMRMTFLTLLFNGLAWLSLYVNPYASLYFLLLWVVPIVTSFSFFMILRQIVQHGNGGRGKLTNTRVFSVHPWINFAVFPMGQDYHLPHHLYASIPHYRLRDLHDLLMQCPEYREQAVEVDGYFAHREDPPTKPTVVDVLGPDYCRSDLEVYVDNEVLENVEVTEKEAILEQAEQAKRGH